MKTIEEIRQQEPVYLNNWSETKLNGLIQDFEEYYAKNEIPQEVQDKYSDLNILFASYGTGNYEGDAFVLLMKGDKLLQVNGGHCSCYGLEGQFEPEEANLEALKNSLVNGRLGIDDYCGNGFNTELKQFLGI